MTNPMPGQAVTPPASVPAPAPDEALLLRQQLQQAQAEIERLSAALQKQPQAQAPLKDAPPEQLTPDQAMEKLLADPVGFIRSLIDTSAQKHLAALKEEAELRGALNGARRRHPEFERFEPFIMQEVTALIENDPDGSIDPWDKLLEKGLERFKVKFRETLQSEIGRQAGSPVESEARPVPHIEGGSNRVTPEEPASFTRDQIARMSLQEFLDKEAAINMALQKNRIR